MSRTRLFAAALCLLLGACASTPQVANRECPAIEAYVQGYRDAASGLASAQLAHDQTVCAARGAVIDADAYALGRQAAIQDVCPQYVKGMPDGAGCPNSMPQIDPISASGKILDQRYTVDKAAAEVRRLQAAVDASQGEQHAELALQLRDAQLRHWWARDTLDRMYWLLQSGLF
ncbi:hypothetical protein [Niveibacterium sp. SC-1]|uniref:hypothetical protein n=1 Tax=Niveibacterium sp. SC-1 TaxID=3135646 RepID=UPI00311E32D0